MTYPTQADRDAAARFISPADGDFDELAELFARHREQAEAETVAGIVAFMRERCLGHDHLADAIEAREWKK